MTFDPSSPMIEISGLTKRFDRTIVMAGLDAVVARGRVTALVGPNAAGKSTLLKCLLGLTRPDTGTIHIDGVRLTADPAYRRAIGYMPQRAAFPENLTGEEAIALLREVIEKTSGILKDPAPTVLFMGFGASSLDFSIRAWAYDYDNSLGIRSDLMTRLLQALVAANIEIPFPQQDLHLRSVSDDARDALLKPADGARPPRA